MRHQLYKITNKLNNKFYIGAHTGNIFEDDYWGSGTTIRQSIEKYGKENFEREVIEEFNNKIKLYKSEAEIVSEEFVSNPMTYNIAVGGTGGNLGTIVNEKISEQMKGKDHMYYGKKRPEHSTWMKENTPFKDKKHTQETLNRIRNSHPKTKRVLQFTKSGEFVKEWDSANQAAKELKASVHRAAMGDYKTAGGFVWKYKEKLHFDL